MRYLYLVFVLVCAGCAVSGPQPGSLLYLKQQMQSELAESCYKELKSKNSYKKTFYVVGLRLVDERNYCRFRARQLLNAKPYFATNKN